MTHIARSTLIVALFFGLEKGLGFLRQLMIARYFGLSSELDAFYAANNLPDLLFALISGGALAMAFIPVLSETIQKGGRTLAWDLFSRIANLVFLATAGISIIIALFASQLVGWRLGIAPGFTSTQQALVTDLMRWNLIATLLFSLAGLAIAGLQANQHFLLPALAPSMYDIGTLIGVIILAPERGYQIGRLILPCFGLGIHGLVYGTILGAALFLGIQIPGLVRYKFRWTPIIHLRHSGVQQVLALMGPRVLTVLCIQLVFIAQDNLASRIATGAVTALVYGWLFMQVPETLIGTAIGTVLLPTLSEQAARQEVDSFRKALNHSLRFILALTLPVTAILLIVIRPFIQLLGFEAAGSEMVVWTSRAYLLGLSGHAMLEVAVRSFYARQDARTPLVAAALTAGAFVLFAWLLARPLGPAGIGLANALAFTGEALVLWWLVNRRYVVLKETGKILLRVTLVALACAGISGFLMSLPLPALPMAVVAFTACALLALPFIWQEVKLLVKL